MYIRLRACNVLYGVCTQGGNTVYTVFEFFNELFPPPFGAYQIDPPKNALSELESQYYCILVMSIAYLWRPLNFDSFLDIRTPLSAHLTRLDENFLEVQMSVVHGIISVHFQGVEIANSDKQVDQKSQECEKDAACRATKTLLRYRLLPLRYINM